MMRLLSKMTVAAATVTLVAMVIAPAAMAAEVAHYTFDDVDSTLTGDGTSIATAYNGTISDVSGNGNTATNISTQEQNPAASGVFGMQILQGQPGLVGQSHKFSRDPSDFNLDSANGSYTIAPGVVPVGAAERTIAVWFKQNVDITAGGSQDKLFGYGTNSSGQALDVSLEGGGLRIRHFGGNITYGSGFDFQATGADAGWHHMAVRVNAGAATFADVDVFLDGVLQAISATGGGGTGVAINTVDAAAATGFPNHGFGIGTSSERAGGSSQNGFDGWLDEMRIYDTAISNADIAALAAVPEPSSVFLLIAGLATSAALWRKRR